jgi:hypothetical protein
MNKLGLEPRPMHQNLNGESTPPHRKRHHQEKGKHSRRNGKEIQGNSSSSRVKSTLPAEEN